MEKRNRNVLVAIVAAILIVCMCLVLLVGLGIGLATNWGRDSGWWRGWQGGLTTETVEQQFQAGAAPTLRVDSFAGDVTVEASTVDVIEVRATKRAPTASGLGRIQLSFEQSVDGLRVTAVRPGAAVSNMSVRLEIRTPPGTRLELSLGAGNVTVDGLTGGIQVDNGAGNIDIRSARGPAQVELGAGNISYEGQLSGDSRLTTGAGNVDLNLPSDANVRVDLTTGIGNVMVSGFDVAGQVSRRSVQGSIGSGADATVTAHSGAGNVSLR